MAVDAQPVALPRGWPDGRRIRRWRRCGAGNSAAAHPTAVVGTSNPAVVAEGRKYSQMAWSLPPPCRRWQAPGEGRVHGRRCRKSGRVHAAPPPS